MKVMIVEDEALIALLLERHVNSLGSTVVANVSRGEDVLTQFENHHPDLVLMDIRLAGAMTGLDAARQLVARGPVKIAFMTAYGTEDIVGEIESIPHVAYMKKPVSTETLRQLITALAN